MFAEIVKNTNQIGSKNRAKFATLKISNIGCSQTIN